MLKNNVKTPVDFILNGVKNYPDSLAVRMTNQNFTYKEIYESIKNFSSFFNKHGIKQDDKVAIYTDNDLEMVQVLFALWGLGAICIPMNINQPADRLREIENIVNPDAGFFSEDYKTEFNKNFPIGKIIWEKDASYDLVSPDPKKIGIIMFTSGTSGIPKAVPMTFFAITHNAMETSRLLNIRNEDRLFINTPPFFTSSIIHVLTMLARGGSIIVDRSFLFGSSILDILNEYDCTGFGGVPVHFNRLLATLNETMIPSKLRFLMNSGDHLPVTVINKIKKYLPDIQIYCVYGLTEVAGRLCILDHKKIKSKIGSVGKPINGMSITIRDDLGNILPPKVTGEVYVNGDCLMSGYLNNQDINKKVLKPYGFSTGDFGYLDEEGYLFLKGRKDDIFKVGGEKVSVKMIEESIIGFEDFEDFVVNPIYDEHIGNIPCVYYVLKKDKFFKRRKLINYIKNKLPKTHIPSRFIELSRIPRTGSGKPVRSDLPKD